MSDYNTSKSFAAKDVLPPRVSVDTSAVQIDSRMLPPSEPKDGYRHNGWVVTWKLKGGQEAFCYMRTPPDPRLFKGGAVVTQLFEKVST